MSNEVLFEDKGDGIVVLTLNRPAQRNAINAAVRESLFSLFQRVEEDNAIRVAILTGAGDQAFCAGADLKEMAERGIGVLPPGWLPILGDTIKVTKPVIAAVNGAALAGGWMFAQMCDLCVAASSAKFGITEAKVGRGFPWAAPLAKMIPQRIMMEILMTGEPITAQRAYEIGFVNQVVEPAEVLPAAIALAKKIAANAPLTVAAAKELVYLTTEMGRSAALRAAEHAFHRVYSSNDAKEGPAAFREKRKPNWTGK